MIMKYFIILKPTFMVFSLKTVPMAILAKSISQNLKLQPYPCSGLHHTAESEPVDAYKPTAAEKSSDPAQHIAPISIWNLLLQVIFLLQNWFD